jgi:hypothetical protein
MTGVVFQCQLDVGRSRVFLYIPERLLGDTQQSMFGASRQCLIDGPVDGFQITADAGPSGEFTAEGFEGCGETVLVE